MVDRCLGLFLMGMSSKEKSNKSEMGEWFMQINK